MTYTPIKRGKYLLGDKWKDDLDRVWRIAQIADSELGSVYRLISEYRRIVLSEYSIQDFLKVRVG